MDKERGLETGRRGFLVAAGSLAAVSLLGVKARVSARPTPSGPTPDDRVTGIVMTPLARDELSGPRGEGYRRMIEGSAAKRAGTPDEVGAVGALLMGPDGGFITGSDILMDGGVTAAYWYGDLAEVRTERRKS